MYQSTGRTKRTWMADLTGQRFGRLTVVSFVGRSGSRYLWNCVCDCGGVKVVAGDKLRHKDRPTRSCGCMIVEATARRSTTHGHSRNRRHTPEYNSWRAMIERCTNSSNKRWTRYGGRGISVCERWRSFENFISDMGTKPTKRHSIERNDNDGNYEPSNCRWATPAEQIKNRSISQRDASLARWRKVRSK